MKYIVIVDIFNESEELVVSTGDIPAWCILPVMNNQFILINPGFSRVT